MATAALLAAAAPSAPGSVSSQPSGDKSLAGHLLLLQGAEGLIAWADELSRQHQRWAQQRGSLLSNRCKRRAASESACAAERSTLTAAPNLLQMRHSLRVADLKGGIDDAKEALRAEHRTLLRHMNDLEEASLKRQRLARCRLARERERLDEEKERARTEADWWHSCGRARVEREREISERHFAELNNEKERLQDELRWQRERRWPLTANAEAQTSPTEAPDTLCRPGSSAASASGDSYAEDFATASEEASYEDDFADATSSEAASGARNSNNSTGSNDSASRRSSGSSSSKPARVRDRRAASSSGNAARNISSSDDRKGSVSDSHASEISSSGSIATESDASAQHASVGASRSGRGASGTRHRTRRGGSSSRSGGSTSESVASAQQQPSRHLEKSPVASADASISEDSFASAESIDESIQSISN